jgi:hypothetical protein
MKQPNLLCTARNGQLHAQALHTRTNTAKRTTTTKIGKTATLYHTTVKYRTQQRHANRMT